MEATPPEASGSRPVTGGPPGMLIRACRPADAEALASLVNLPKYRDGTLRLPFETPEAWRRRIESTLGGQGELLLAAVLDNRLVGTAGLRRYQGRRSHAADIGMGVHDAYHGRGIGRALLTVLVDSADHWLGVRRLELTVFADNAPAIHFYRSFGFEQEGILRGFAFRHGAYADALAMARLRRVAAD